MTKWQEFKDKIKNPPPQRLAAIEYKSYLFQALSTAVVIGILIYKQTLWYISLILVFNIFLAYAQGIGAYKKYRMIMEYVPKETPIDYEKDISPSRRRSKIISYVMGRKAHWISLALAVASPYFILPKLHWSIYGLTYLFSVILIYSLVYFFLLYYIAHPIYTKKLKGGKQ